IGAQNKASLPIETSAGGLKAFSLNPEVAEVVEVDGVPMIEGLKNGVTEVMVSDANNNYKSLKVDVYTTNDKLELNAASLTAKLPYGLRATTTDAYVVLGNGGYVITCDNEAVEASIDSESGVIRLTTIVNDDPVECKITVTDCRKLSASMNVTIEGDLIAFTDGDLLEISEIDYNTGQLDGKTPSYLYDPECWFGQRISDGMITFGGIYEVWGYTGAAAQIVYPEGTKVGEEVDGTFIYGDWSRDEYPGKVKILVDNDAKRVGVWYNVDKEAKKVSRGYVVWKK
ncbi:MAG: hypothetical protein K2J10_04375, partial [Muribaculaceae bacterium]|nr:hypothetical protein [Muribaculaceae bacterium]